MTGVLKRRGSLDTETETQGKCHIIMQLWADKCQGWKTTPRNYEEARKNAAQNFRGSMVLVTSWLWTSSLQNFERIISVLSYPVVLNCYESPSNKNVCSKVIKMFVVKSELLLYIIPKYMKVDWIMSRGWKNSEVHDEKKKSDGLKGVVDRNTDIRDDANEGLGEKVRRGEEKASTVYRMTRMWPKMGMLKVLLVKSQMEMLNTSFETERKVILIINWQNSSELYLLLCGK